MLVIIIVIRFKINNQGNANLYNLRISKVSTF